MLQHWRPGLLTRPGTMRRCRMRYGRHPALTALVPVLALICVESGMAAVMEAAAVMTWVEDATSESK
jgi:hypothetical protein